MNIQHPEHGIIEDVQDDWFGFMDDYSARSNHGWTKDGAWYFEDDGWENTYQRLPAGSIPDIQHERNKRDRAERLSIRPKEPFRQVDALLGELRAVLEQEET